MRKLKLEIDDLRVDSFAVNPQAPPRRGTVRGHLPTQEGSQVTTEDDIPFWRTWWYTCQPGYTEGTCQGPTFCCAPTWEKTCAETCYTCPDYLCAI